MVSIDKIERGFTSFVDKEFIPMFPGSTLKGIAISVGAAVLSRRIGTALESLKGNEMLASIGIIDAAGNVDIDIIRDELMKKMSPEGIKVEIPMIGDLVFKKDDIEKLYRRILEA